MNHKMPCNVGDKLWVLGWRSACRSDIREVIVTGFDIDKWENIWVKWNCSGFEQKSKDWGCSWEECNCWCDYYKDMES